MDGQTKIEIGIAVLESYELQAQLNDLPERAAAIRYCIEKLKEENEYVWE